MQTQTDTESADFNASEQGWITISHLEKLYQPKRRPSVHALSDINFTVRKGEFVSLVGPSGCGKTTLLKILAGLSPKTSGTVQIAGKDVNGPLPEVGMVFQAATLLPWRTILENVMVPVELQGRNSKEYLPRAMDLLKMVGLEGFEDKYPKELSGGMQQRAGICRALVHDPEVLLMDEPFGALDAMTREYMNLELLRIWKESGKTIVLVTHSISEAVLMSDRVVVLSPRPGRLADIVDITLPRPRELRMLTTDEAGVHSDYIRSYFNSAGVIE